MLENMGIDILQIDVFLKARKRTQKSYVSSPLGWSEIGTLGNITLWIALCYEYIVCTLKGTMLFFFFFFFYMYMYHQWRI